jgi:dGTPase
MLIREMLEEQERNNLSPYAKLSSETKGRAKQEEPCPIRPAFQHDRDRIIHSKSFRRLKHKTQVFLSPTGDHYRTRLTHTLEVSQIARTIAKALRLNEDLTEAIAMAHDLGHPPFGHAGEEVLDRILPQGFKHFQQSLRVVEYLEKDGQGLNLTYEVRNGVSHHSKGQNEILSGNTEEMASTLEGRVVRIADIVAYVNHDLDDALRGEVIKEGDIPQEFSRTLGNTHSQRINTMVTDIIFTSLKDDGSRIRMSKELYESLKSLRDFLYTHVYTQKKVYADFIKCSKILTDLYQHYLENVESFSQEVGKLREEDPSERRVCDFIAGMTDRYALQRYQEIFIPRPWVA